MKIRSAQPRPILTAVLVWTLWLVCLLLVVLPVAETRHYQVDEFNNAYNAMLLGPLGHPEWAHPIEPLYVIVARAFDPAEGTAALLSRLRLLAVLLCAGISLTVAWAQRSYRSAAGRGVIALITLLSYPLFRHVLEFRHDPIIAMGLLFLLGCALRAEPKRPLVALAVLAGAAAAGMHFHSYKSLALALPALALVANNEIITKPGPERVRVARRFLGLALTGFAAMSLVSCGVLAWGGALGAYLQSLKEFVSYATATEGFPPYPLLLQTALCAPAVATLWGLFLVNTARSVSARGALRSRRSLTLLAFPLLGLAVLFASPAPYPYNLIWFYPLVLLGALSAARRLDRRLGLPAGLAILSGVTLLEFLRGTTNDAYTLEGNAEQLELIEVAEALTPANVPVLDLSGIVATRPPLGRHWMMHSLYRQPYAEGRRTQVRAFIKEQAPPVAILSYRFEWIVPEDHQMLKERYVKVAPALAVLGGNLKGPSGKLRVYRAGRYRFEAGAEGQAPHLVVSGKPVPADGLLVLPVGEHSFESAAPMRRFYWVGEQLEWISAKSGPKDTFFPLENDYY